MTLAGKIKFGFILGILFIFPVFAQTGEIQIPVGQIDSLIKERINIFVQDNSGTILELVSKKDELLNLKKEVLEQGQKKVDWWLTVIATLITIVTTIASLVFAYNVISIKKSLKEVQDEAFKRIQELGEIAEKEKEKLEKNYSEKEDFLKKEQDVIKQSIEFITDFSVAIGLLGGKRYNEAKVKYEVLLKKNNLTKEQRAMCFRHLGIIFYEQNPKDLNSTLDCYKEAKNLGMTSSGLMFNIARVLIELKKYTEAISIIEEGLCNFPNDANLMDIKDEATQALMVSGKKL
ncbi:MAG: hypothetical protein WC774_02875 [Candidatus Gracilibacteria bacterium]